MSSREGTVAVVTGAGRGMGRQIAWSLAGAGAQVVACARTAADLDETVAGGEAAAGDLLGIEPDSHRVAAGAEDLHVADAVQPRQLVLDPQLGVVGQVQRVVAVVR